jgi:saccharopine dehydrogenase-like NADP-dependent oxidoreductase
MKIAVLGAAGKMAPGVIRDLADSPEVEEIILIDLEQTKAMLQKRSDEWGKNKTRIAFGDLNDIGGLRRVIRGASALANCTIYLFNLQVMEACLAEGVHYVDMGGLFHVSRKQMQLHDQWAKKGLTAVLGMGSAPGIVNVMSRYAVDMLDTVESILIRDGIVNFTKSETPLTIPYALGTLLDEFILNPYVFENGEWKEVPPFYGAEVIDFPPPVGPQTVYCTLHSEEATIPATFKSKGLKHMSFKLALPEAFEKKLRFLVDLGMGSKDSIEVKGTSVVPRDFIIALTDRLPRPTAKPDDHKVLRVDVSGNKAGQKMDVRLEMICDPFEPWGMATGPHSVGVPAGVTCRLLGSGEINERGCVPAEVCVPPNAFFTKLAERNLHTTVMVKHAVV